MKSVLASLILASLVFTATLAQARLVVMPKYEHEVILKSHNQDAENIVHLSILKSAARLGWIVAADDGKTMRLTLDVRTHKVMIDVRIFGNAVAVDYISSKNMDYDKNYSETGEFCIPAIYHMNGKEVIHSKYADWITRLLRHASAEATISVLTPTPRQIPPTPVPIPSIPSREVPPAPVSTHKVPPTQKVTEIEMPPPRYQASQKPEGSFYAYSAGLVPEARSCHGTPVLVSKTAAHELYAIACNDTVLAIRCVPGRCEAMK